MERSNKKCSLKKHEDIDAISFCQNCRIYMCNKCENFHSELFQNHHEYKLDKEKNYIFTGYCTVENHNEELEYFCKTHNQLCCGLCITKIKKKGKGQHTECDICTIEDIKEDKKNKLKQNIKTLEDLSNILDNSIKQLRLIFEKISENKEELKLKIFLLK